MTVRTTADMGESRPKMQLMDFVMQLPEGGDRERVLQALWDAEHTPVDKQTVDEIEARYGDGAGLIDLQTWMLMWMREHPTRSEFESLMRAAWMLRVRLAFNQVDTEEGPRFVRTDHVQ